MLNETRWWWVSAGFWSFSVTDTIKSCQWVERSKPWLSVVHSISRNSPSLALGSGASKFSWTWQHHQSSRTRNVRWEPVELLGWLQGRFKAPEAVIAITLGSPQPNIPLVPPYMTPMDCIFWTGHTQYHSTKTSFTASVLIQKEKKKIKKLGRIETPKFPESCWNQNKLCLGSKQCTEHSKSL